MMVTQSTSRLLMLTGQLGAGKTTFCRSLASHTRLQGWDVAGLLSPAIFDGKIKTGILVEDIRTGEMHSLASSSPCPSFDLPIGDWHFARSSMAWCNKILENSMPCDLLIIDELGPLELAYHTGWLAALKILRGNEYKVALVVIRPMLQDLASRLFNFSETLNINHTKTINHWVRLYWPKIKAAFSPEIQLLNASKNG